MKTDVPPDLAMPLAKFVRCGKDCYTANMYEFERDGISYSKQACSTTDLIAIERALDGIPLQSAGTRLFGLPGLADPLATNGCVGRIAAKFIGPSAFPVRAILFDKSATSNWGLGWHQDRTIVVRKRIKVDDFGPWTLKAGHQHAAPPIRILSQMVTVRLHLDAVPPDNAPLIVALGSHRLGKVSEAQIKEVVQRSSLVKCLAERGDIWAYSTPILHASDRAMRPGQRRVLQVDYAATDLPGGLKWVGIL